MKKNIRFENDHLKNPPLIIFSDIDGTILDSRHQLSDRTRQAIATISLKVPFVFASGRNPQALIYTHDILLKKAPLIALNGTLILDENFQIIHQLPLEPHYVANMLNEFKKWDFEFALNLYTAKNWYSNNPTYSGQLNEEKIVGFPAKKMPQPFPIVEEPVLKIGLIAGSQQIPLIISDLEEKFPYVKVSQARHDLIEIYNLSASKGQALSRVLEYYQLTYKEALAVGDSPLDYPLLSNAGYKATVANAYDDLKRLANIHLPTNDEDGVALLLEYYLTKIN